MRRFLDRIRNVGWCIQATQRAAQAALSLAAFGACQRVRETERIDSLADIEFRVSSQWGEDGIIEWLVHVLRIEEAVFVEFGVHDYAEANTRFLLQNRNWQGLVMDGDAGLVRRITEDALSWRHDLRAAAAFVTAENINELIAAHGVSGRIGLLSIDIDGNDYWVWRAISVVDPVVVICEYNAVLGDLHAVSIPYDSGFERTRAHHSNLYFGASIAALEALAAERGYTLVGSNRAGSNAFFVRNDRMPLLAGRIASMRARCSVARESRGPDGTLSFVPGLRRAELIRHLPVEDVRSGKRMPLAALGLLYSPEWRAAMRLRD